MKKLRWLSALMALLMLAAVITGCNGGGATTSDTESVVSGEENTESGEGTTDVTSDEDVVDTESTDATESTGDSTNATSSNKGNGTTNTASKGNTNATSSEVYAEAVKPVNKDFGVTTTRKMPNYVKELTSVNMTMIRTDKMTDESVANMRQAFKALTGKDIVIKQQVVEWNTLPDRVAGMVTAKQAPDLVHYNAIKAPYMIQKPYWENIDNYVNMNDALWKAAKEYNPDSIFTYKGGRYAITTTSPSKTGGPSLADGYIYNTALVKEAIAGNPSLKDPQQMFAEGKWDWNALYAFVEEITTDDNNDGVPEIYGHVMETSRPTAYIASTGQDIVKFGNDGKITYNLEHKDVIRAMNFVKKLYDVSNHPAPWDGLKEVVAKKAGFFYGNIYWTRGSTKSYEEAHKKGQIAFVPMPQDPNSNAYYKSVASGCWFIPKGAKNPYLSGAYLYYQQYLGYNPNKKLQEAEVAYLKECGFSDVELGYIDGSATKHLNYKPIYSGIGERIDGFSMAYLYNPEHGVANPKKTVTQIIQEAAPKLKTAIERFNNAK